MTTFYNLVAQLLKVLLAFEPNVTTVEAITRSNRLSMMAYSVAAAASSSKASDFSCFSICDDPFGIFILLAAQIEASLVSPLPRSKRNHCHCGNFQVLLDFSRASNQTARGITPVTNLERICRARRKNHWNSSFFLRFFLFPVIFQASGEFGRPVL